MSNTESRGKECPCPACGFYTIGEPTFGSYNICQICGWEDDPVQMTNPASGGGANKEPLIDCQERVLQAYPVGVLVAGGYSRDPLWRPMNSDEKAQALKERAVSPWTHMGGSLYTDAYWAKPQAEGGSLAQRRGDEP